MTRGKTSPAHWQFGSQRGRAAWASVLSPDIWISVATMATLDVRSGSLNRSLARGIALNHAPSANASEPARTLPRIDKLGVTGSSPVPPIRKGPAQAGFLFSIEKTTEGETRLVSAICQQLRPNLRMTTDFADVSDERVA